MQETVNKVSHLVAWSSNSNMFCQYRLNVRNLYACGTLADINVTTSYLRTCRERANTQQNRLYQTTATRNVSAVVSKITVFWLLSQTWQFLSSSVLDNPPPEMTSGSDRGRSIKEDLKAALGDPYVLELVSNTIHNTPYNFIAKYQYNCARDVLWC